MISPEATPQVKGLMDLIVGQRPTTAVEPVTAERLEATLRAGRSLAVWGSLVLLTAHFSNAFLLGHEIPGLDANHEGTPLTWASAVATAAVAVAAILAAILTGPFLRLMGLGLATAFLSLDDMVALHERTASVLVVELGLTDAWDSALWPLLYLPLLVITALLILRMARAGTPDTFRAAVVGLGLLGAALALEVLTSPWSSGTNLMHTVQGGIEEALELAGWVLISSSALATMVANVVRQAVTSAVR